MNKKLLSLAIVPAAAAAIWGANVASAHGWGAGLGMSAATPADQATRFTEMVKQQAGFLGATEAEVKQAWAEGKTMQQLAESKGITQDQLRAKMDEARQVQVKEHLQNLVSQGVITQAQADSHLAAMEKVKAKAGNGKGRGIHRGMGMGMFGF